jgi:uncharacterized protein YdgA (DUF945 family)
LVSHPFAADTDGARQSWNERAGKATKTIDLDLQPRFDLLRSLQNEYKALCEIAKSMARHVDSSAKTHEAIGTRLDGLSKLEDSNVQGLFQTQAQFMVFFLPVACLLVPLMACPSLF